DRIANLFRGEPPQVEVRKEIVFGIDLYRSRVNLARHSENIGRQDHSMQRLQFHSARGELGDQPIEQFRMCRRGALIAEIARGPDNSTAEMVLPDAVD